MYLATAGFEGSAFGGILYERGGSNVKHMLVFSGMLDHTALGANQLIDLLLEQRFTKDVKHVDLVADPREPNTP